MKGFYKSLTKNALLTVIIVHLTFLGFSATYYVSSSGNDSNSGLSISLPWKTLGKVNASTFVPGDQILFKRGDTFYGSLTIGQSGTSGSRIVYGPYGTGANPIITGFTAVTSWTNLGSNIWESTNAVSALSVLNMVVINGINTPMGRIPNTGYYYYQSHSDNFHITSNNLTGTPDWTGAELALNVNYWETKRCPITYQSGGTLLFTQREPFSIAKNGLKFIIQNDARTLDVQNEWYYNPTTKKIRVYSTSEPAGVKVASTDVLVTINSNIDYVTFDNVSFEGANSKAFQIFSCDYITIQNCSVSFSGQEGIYGGYYSSTNLTVNNCSFTDSNSGTIGITKYFSNGTFSSNTINNSGMVYGAAARFVNGTNNSGVAYGISANGSGNTFEYNTITNTGYVGIRFIGNNVTVRNNYIYKYCQNHHDGGGIYTWTGPTNDTYSNQQILNNVVINEVVNTDQADGKSGQHDAGIYLDHNSNGVTISGNTLSGSGMGLFFISTHEVTASDNVIYNNDIGIRYYTFTGYNMANMTVTGNKIFARSTTQLVVTADPIQTIKPYLTTNNNYYGRPIADNTTFRIVDRTSGTVTNNYTLEQWKTYSGQDANSQKSPQSITSENDLSIEYNVTKSIKTVSLSQPMIDVKGTKYAGSVTLQPYTSVILMKDANPDLSDVTAPVLSAFSIPTISTLLAVPITSLSASDNVGVTGFLLTETSTKPSPGESGWSTTKPTSYTFSSVGAKTLYAWAKDAAGNVSTSLSSGLNITLSVPTPDNSSVLFPEYSTYSFEELSGTNVIDSSSSHDGNIVDTASRVTGKSGNGMSFTGTGYINLGQVYGDVQNDLTLSAWVKPTPSGGYVGVIMHGGPNTDSFSLFLNHTLGTIAFKTEGTTSGAWTEIANSTIWDGSWHLLTATYDGSRKIIYLDAVPIITVSASGTIDSGSGYNLLIGAGRDEIPVPSAYLYQGLIDEVRIYNYTLNSSQISSLYNSIPIASVFSSEYKSICDGSSYNGWITTGKYERTLMSKSGGDSIVTTFLTVNPKYLVTEDLTINNGENYNGWTSSGQYSRTLSSVSGCDSIVTTNLTVATTSVKEGAIQPSHFIPVWNGENGQNHMNFIVVSAMLEDIALVAADEIGLFSGNLCVGAQILTKEINSADNSTFLTIQASQDDGSNNGFINNDTIIVKMWDHRNQVEMFAKAVIYRNDMLTWITSGKYTAGATAVIEIVSYIEYTQTIELKKGYNMISTNVTANNTLAGHITQPLVDQGDLIKVQDEAGNSLENWGSLGGWVNNIGSFQITEGYKIKVANNCTLQITGRFIALPLEIPLKTGWNIISFPRTDIVDGMAVVQSLVDQGKLVKVQDEAGNSIENWGVYGGWKNDIGNFIPGKAYKIKMSADAIVSINESYLKSSIIMAQTEPTNYFQAQVEGNGTDHMNINIVGLPESGVSVGDELAAFDDDVCVGTLKITSNHLNTGTACLIASSADDKGLVGFKSGNKILVYSWDQVTGNETEVQTEVVKGQLSYEINGSVMVKLKSSSTNVVEIDDAVKIDVFPNPSSGRVTVRFSEMPAAGSKIEITDIAGRMISSRLISDTSEEFNLDQQSGGLYLVKTILGSNTTIQKLVIRK